MRLLVDDSFLGFFSWFFFWYKLDQPIFYRILFPTKMDSAQFLPFSLAGLQLAWEAYHLYLVINSPFA